MEPFDRVHPALNPIWQTGRDEAAGSEAVAGFNVGRPLDRTTIQPKPDSQHRGQRVAPTPTHSMNLSSAIPSRPALPPTSMSQQFPSPPIQQAKTMTEAISLTTSAKKISALAAEAGAYIVSQASRLIDGTAEDVMSELAWVNGGVRHVLLGTRIEPFRGSFSAVRAMDRFALVRSQAGNEAHVERVIAAVRNAMADRDVVAADRAVRAIGAEGFATEVTGV